MIDFNPAITLLEQPKCVLGENMITRRLATVKPVFGGKSR